MEHISSKGGRRRTYGGRSPWEEGGPHSAFLLPLLPLSFEGGKKYNFKGQARVRRDTRGFEFNFLVSRSRSRATSFFFPDISKDSCRLDWHLLQSELVPLRFFPWRLFFLALCPENPFLFAKPGIIRASCGRVFPRDLADLCCVYFFLSRSQICTFFRLSGWTRTTRLFRVTSSFGTLRLVCSSHHCCFF